MRYVRDIDDPDETTDAVTTVYDYDRRRSMYLPEGCWVVTTSTDPREKTTTTAVRVDCGDPPPEDL